MFYSTADTWPGLSRWLERGRVSPCDGLAPSLNMYTRNSQTYVSQKKTSAVKSRISSKLITASCVGYFDRAYCGFYVTSSRMQKSLLRRTKSDSCGTQWMYKYAAVDMYATLLLIKWFVYCTVNRQTTTRNRTKYGWGMEGVVRSITPRVYIYLVCGSAEVYDLPRMTEN